MAKKISKKQIVKRVVAGTAILLALANPINTIALALAEGKDTASSQTNNSDNLNESVSLDVQQERTEDIEEITGVSVEQMQEDFLAATENATEAIIEQPDVALFSLSQNSDYLYLSDIAYDASSAAPYGGIKVNKNVNGDLIALLVNGEKVTFQKGLGAHATSNIIYDVEAYTQEYPILDTYMGVDACQSGKGEVKFTIYGSNDKSKWDVLYAPDSVTSGNEAIHAHIDVSAYKYIKLHANQWGVDYNDHAVYGGLKLVSKDYDASGAVYQGIKTLEEYDAELSKNTAEYNYTNNKKTVLKRELVRRIGYQNLQNAYLENKEDMDSMLNWLFNDTDALELFIEAGDYFSGNGYKAITTLNALYATYKDDMSTPIYKKMLLATAAAYSREVRNYLVDYGGYSIASNPIERYRIMKKLYDNGRFVRQSEFENYPMELIRVVMGARLADDEIEWLRNYIDVKYGSDVTNYWRYCGYGYIWYNSGNLSNSAYYNLENYDKWNEKYKFTGTGLEQGQTYGYGTANLSRIWMMMEAGGICWGISGVGNAVNNVQGIASLHTYQPGHEAEMSYQQVNGKGTWVMNNDVGGWQTSFTRWGSTTSTEVRLPLQWGQMEFNKLNGGNNSTYILLAQDAFNNYEAYKQSMYYALIANSYTDKNKEDAYKKSLEAYNKNVDATYGLIKYYSSVESTSQETWLDLATTIAEDYKFFPAPMVDLMNQVKKYVTNDTYVAQINTMKTLSLQRAASATASDTTQPNDCKKIANSLLGSNTVELATFSFNGEYANTVKLNSVYDDSNLAIRISLDGGQTWLKFNELGFDNEYTSEHAVKLTDEQVAQITAENDILVGLMGVPKDTNYRIDIKEGKKLSGTIYKNDEENVLVGDIESLEYSTDDGNTWQDYVGGLESNIRFEGRQVVKFRYKPHSVYLQGPMDQYTFTEDTDTETSKYLQLRHVQLKEFSSQQSTSADHAAKNLIDGNGNTAWHTKYSTYDAKYYVVEFDKVRYINKLRYLPGGSNGRLRAGQIYTSLDGENWTLAYEFSGLQNNANWQTIDFGKNLEAKYMKIVATQNYGNSEEEGKMYFSGKMLEFYEDTTQTYQVQPTVEYSETNLTNQNVTATLILPDGCKADVTEYVFEDNGSYGFDYFDADGKIQTVDAVVTWIDKVAPTAQLTYSEEGWTANDVTASLNDISEEVTFLDGSNGTYTFTQNGTYTFRMQDAAGNVSEYPATVVWTDKARPNGIALFSFESNANNAVTSVSLNLSGTQAQILSVNGDAADQSGIITQNGVYTFRMRMADTGYEFEYTVHVNCIGMQKPALANGESDESNVVLEGVPVPTVAPTVKPTAKPTAQPTAQPTAKPNVQATAEPTAKPNVQATAQPTAQPDAQATTQPAANGVQATAEPTTEGSSVVISVHPNATDKPDAQDEQKEETEAQQDVSQSTSSSDDSTESNSTSEATETSAEKPGKGIVPIVVGGSIIGLLGIGLLLVKKYSFFGFFQRF